MKGWEVRGEGREEVFLETIEEGGMGGENKGKKEEEEVRGGWME